MDYLVEVFLEMVRVLLIGWRDRSPDCWNVANTGRSAKISGMIRLYDLLRKYESTQAISSIVVSGNFIDWLLICEHPA
jgi:hypothetical protein